MLDREKVITAFEVCKSDNHTCSDCPYNDESCTNTLSADALELLKEQEAVEPIPPEDEFGLYRCGKCHHQLFRCVDKYCSRCGRAVKWE